MLGFLWFAFYNTAFGTAVWFGFVEGVEGAQHLVKFIVWVFMLPMSTLMFVAMDETVKKYRADRAASGKKGSYRVRRFVAGLVNAAAACLMVWHGHFMSAMVVVAWVFAVECLLRNAALPAPAQQTA